MNDKQLEGLIEFWKSKLLHDRHLMTVSTQTLVQQTINYLEELQKLKLKETK
ncbi:hypothetical protein ES703_95265 [subsurface metagenome]